MSEMHHVHGCMLTADCPTGRIEVGDDDAVIVFGDSDEPPSVAPIDEPGTYDVDAEQLSDDPKWPLILLVVPCAHVPAFMKIPTAKLREMVAALSRDADRLGDHSGQRWHE